MADEAKDVDDRPPMTPPPRPTAAPDRPGPGAARADDGDSGSLQPAAPLRQAMLNQRRRPQGRWLLWSGIAIVVVAIGLYFGVPVVQRALHTVSTDDAY